MREDANILKIQQSDMNYDSVRKNPTSFLTLTSTKVDLFDQILPFFKAANDEYFQWHDVKSRKITRRRIHCIQSNSPLETIEERLFFILTFLKQQPDTGISCSGLRYVPTTVRTMGAYTHGDTERCRRCGRNAPAPPVEFRKVLDERAGEKILYARSSTIPEREIPRPVAPEVQADFYGGKKKKQTVNNAVINVSLI